MTILYRETLVISSILHDLDPSNYIEPTFPPLYFVCCQFSPMSGFCSIHQFSFFVRTRKAWAPGAADSKRRRFGLVWFGLYLVTVVCLDIALHLIHLLDICRVEILRLPPI